MDRYRLTTIWTFSRLAVIMIITIVSSLGCGGKPLVRIAVPELPPPVTKIDKPIRVALVLGSGSFVGAFYADEPNVSVLKAKLLSAKYEQLVDTHWINTIQAPFCPTGPIRGYALQQFMRTNMRSQDFSELKIPLVVVTTSLLNNQMEILQSGPIIPAVHASSALPPYFAPVHIYQNKFIDGGVIAPVPVGVAKQFNPKLIIAVEITKRPSLSELRNAFDITGRALDISFAELAIRQASGADIVIRPDIIGYGPFEDQYNEEFYQAGCKAAMDNIEAIKKHFQTSSKLAPLKNYP